MLKRGLSEVVTITLIILLTISAVVIVWVFVRSFLIDSLDSSNADALRVSLYIVSKSIKIDEATKHVKFNAERGPGGEGVGLKIILEDSEGKINATDASTINELETKLINIYYAGSGLKNIAKISIAPTIKNSKGKEFVGAITESKEIETPKKYEFTASELGLNGYWDFEEILNGNVIDKSGNNIDGIVSGAVISNGKLGNGLKFDGIDDYVSMGNNPVLDQDFTQLSLAFWMYADSIPGADAGLVGKFVTYGITYYTNGNVYFYIGGGGNNIAVPVGSGAWHYVVGTFNGTDMSLYVDGELKAAKVSAFVNTGTARIFTIGSANSFFNGKIDEARIYNRALNVKEIAALFEQGN